MKSKSQIFFILFILHSRPMRSIVFLIGFSFFIFHSSIVETIEVGGNISEDTIWSPENNPYEVVQHITVEEGVTLRILPGTIIKVNSARLMTYEDHQEYFYFGWDNSVKKIFSMGRIIAEGTEEDSIYFMRRHDEPFHKWGGIFCCEDDNVNIFKYCNIKQTAAIGNPYGYGFGTIGSLTFHHTPALVESCTFSDAYGAIQVNPESDVLIKDNLFKMSGELNVDECFPYQKIISLQEGDADRVFIVNNYVNTYGNVKALYKSFGAGREFVIGNTFETQPEEEDACWVSSDSYAKMHILNNTFIYTDLSCGSFDSSIIKGNSFTDWSFVDYGYAAKYFFDNDFFNSVLTLSSGYEDEGLIVNNYFEGNATASVNQNTYNNIYTTAYEIGLSHNSDYTPYIYNCNFTGNQYAISMYQTYLNEIVNCIILENDELLNGDYYDSVEIVIKNCIIDFELPVSFDDVTFVDGGGNIRVDSADSVFVDWQNGDFRLREDSPAIDAGCVDPGFEYPEYDFAMNKRIYDGDGDGVARIDIGAYEYGSEPLNSISGYVTESDTGEPVEYAFLQFGDQPENCTAADSNGYYSIQLPNSHYDVTAIMALHDDTVVEGVALEDEDVELDIEMVSIVDTVGTEEELIIDNAELIINCYPNPFNISGKNRTPSTTISFSLPQDGKVEIDIYNVKGQKVKRVVSDNFEAGNHSITWNGTDNNNRSVSSGVYFMRLSVDGKNVDSRKMLLLK